MSENLFLLVKIPAEQLISLYVNYERLVSLFIRK